MALSNLTPVTRPEAILDGSEITPVTRREYFLQKAATSGGGGAEVLTVTLSYDDVTDDGFTYVADVSVDDTIAAMEAGKIVIVDVSGVRALCGHIFDSENPNPSVYINYLLSESGNMNEFHRMYVGVSGTTWRFIGGSVALTPET